MFYMPFGILSSPMKLDSYLKESKLTQVDFAARLGVKQSTVSRWLAGVRRPTLDLARKIEVVTRRKVCIEDWVPTTRR